MSEEKQKHDYVEKPQGYDAMPEEAQQRLRAEAWRSCALSMRTHLRKLDLDETRMLETPAVFLFYPTIALAAAEVVSKVAATALLVVNFVWYYWAVWMPKPEEPPLVEWDTKR